MITIPIHNTKFLPLRWFANWCNHIGTPYLVKLFGLQDKNVTSGMRWGFYMFMWDWTNSVYKKWGTTYKIIDLEMYKELLDKLGSDYDENGTPYWEKWENGSSEQKEN